MSDPAQYSSESDDNNDSSDAELQEAFAAGLIKPGLNEVAIRKKFVNDTNGLRQKTEEISLDLPWIEQLDCINKQAPLAPELAAQLTEQETKHENQVKNNKKLQQAALHEDNVLNDFKREMMFYRQAQATILEAIPKIKALGLLSKRPDDYFAEMAKSDEHMQKIREKLMQKQVQQQRSEKVKQLRKLRKEGKAIQIQAKQERQKEKKNLMEQVKKVRKGMSSDMSFLDKKGGNSKALSKKQMEKQQMKQKKFGFGGKKRGSKMNTRESAADFSEYDRSRKSGKHFKQQKKSVNKRPGKSRRIKSKNKGKK